MKVSVSTISIAELDVDLLFVPVSSEEIDSGLEALTEAFGGVVERARSDVRGDGSNATVLYPETGTAKRIVLVGLGTAETTKTNFFSIGAFMTTALFLFTSYFFGIYIDNFSTYNQLYGALGGLLILMFYIWINSNILLLGFELNMSLFSLKSGIVKNKEDS